MAKVTDEQRDTTSALPVLGGGDSARRSRPTARDVAQLARVSQSTVSRVLSGAGAQFISEATSQRVHTVARQLGYSPHPLARALRGKRTHLIGLIVPEIADPFFANFVAVLSSQSRDLGYQLILGYVHSSPAAALRVTSFLDPRHCDGILLLGDLCEDRDMTLERLKDSRAVVALCWGHSRNLLPSVNVDNRAGIRLLLDHLCALGHRRLAFIDGGCRADILERRGSFLEYAREKRIAIPQDCVLAEANDLGGGYRAVQRLLNLSPRPTAIMASDDVVALGAIKAATDAGLRVPQDVSITGFDDIEQARFSCPSLTTVHQPVQEMGREALQMLLDLMADRTTPESGPRLVVQPELFIRQSTGPALVD